MPNPLLKDILDAVAKSASKVDGKAEEINKSQECPNCGHPVETQQPEVKNER